MHVLPATLATAVATTTHTITALPTPSPTNATPPHHRAFTPPPHRPHFSLFATIQKARNSDQNQSHTI